MLVRVHTDLRLLNEKTSMFWGSGGAARWYFKERDGLILLKIRRFLSGACTLRFKIYLRVFTQLARERESACT
jgi:hypothetical protein